MTNILYIHGMGGGGDSRIPSILDQALMPEGVRVIVRTYDFDPQVASRQIASWVDELQPRLIMGESLGSLHAIRIKGIPHILISPSLNASLYFSNRAWLTLVPGVTALLDRIYRPREGDRQILHFTTSVLRKYKAHGDAALAKSVHAGSKDEFFAFIGTKDHYRRTGVVSIKAWKRHFGETFRLYEGSHFTEEEYIHALVVPKILEMLDIKE